VGEGEGAGEGAVRLGGDPVIESWLGGRLAGAVEPRCAPGAGLDSAVGLAARGGSVLEADGVGNIGKEASGGGPEASTGAFGAAEVITLPTGGIEAPTLFVPLDAPAGTWRAGGWAAGRLAGAEDFSRSLGVAEPCPAALLGRCASVLGADGVGDISTEASGVGLEEPGWLGGRLTDPVEPPLRPVPEGSRRVSATGSIGSRAGPDFWSPGLFPALGGGIAATAWSRAPEEACGAWGRSAKSCRCRARIWGLATAAFGGESPCEDFMATARGLSVPEDGSAEPTGGIDVAPWLRPVEAVRAESVPGDWARSGREGGLSEGNAGIGAPTGGIRTAPPSPRPSPPFDTLTSFSP
jgi:hypothetical protein